MATGRRVLWLVALLLATLAVAASAQDSSTNGTSSANSTVTLTQCEQCRNSGAKTCSLAYQNGPGDYCGNWLSNTGATKACCCPVGYCYATNSNYECKCKAASKKKPTWYIDAVGGAFVVGLVLVGGCMYFARKRREQEYANAPPVTTYVQPTAYPAGGYVQGYPQAPAPGYTQAYDQYGRPIGGGYAPGYGGGGYNQGYGGRSGGGYGGGAVVAGAAGGFLGGMIVGDMLADAGDHGGFGGGGDFGGGGGDGGFAGDF